jgi:hypothetical protein
MKSGNFVNYTDIVHVTILPSHDGSSLRSCVTYDPPGATKPGEANLVELKMNQTNIIEWGITLHNKDHMITDNAVMFGSTYILMDVHVLLG